MQGRAWHSETAKGALRHKPTKRNQGHRCSGSTFADGFCGYNGLLDPSCAPNHVRTYPNNNFCAFPREVTNTLSDAEAVKNRVKNTGLRL